MIADTLANKRARARDFAHSHGDPALTLTRSMVSKTGFFFACEGIMYHMIISASRRFDENELGERFIKWPFYEIR